MGLKRVRIPYTPSKNRSLEKIEEKFKQNYKNCSNVNILAFNLHVTNIAMATIGKIIHAHVSDV